MSQGSDNKQLEEIERLSRYNERLLLENAQLKRKMDELEFADGDFGDEISRKQFREGDAENGSS